LPKRPSLFAIAAWGLLAAVALATLVPVGLRPVSPLSPQWERLLTFMLVGFVFAFIYRRQVWLVALLVLGAAVGLELLQLLVSSRHAGLADVGAKVLGGCIGLVGGWAAAVLRDRIARRS
jgi:VanZ family protein